MRPKALLLSLLLLAGCQTYGDEPDHILSLAGDYQSVADCFYLANFPDGSGRKEELRSLNTSRVFMGNDDFTVLRVDFVGIDPDRTEMRAFTSGMAFGKANWLTTYKPSAVECSQQIRVEIPPSKE